MSGGGGALVSDRTLHLHGESDAVPKARHWVAAALAESGLGGVVADAELAVSELVTNALLHGAPPVSVHVDVREGSVRVEVADGSRHAPVRAIARQDAMTGRGLSLVAALARDWGVEQRPHGKAVWAELSATAPTADEPDVEVDIDALLAAWDDDEDDGVVRYTVMLGDVPTDLLLAAKAHVDNLVREFALAAHGAESGRTAAIPPQLAELIEVVVSRFGEARQAIKRQAVDAATHGRQRTVLTLTLPLDAADAGLNYLAALDELDTYARAARLLTLETPPQHRVFRQWYVGAIVTQLRAAAAGEVPPPQETFEQRLLDAVRVIEVARRAADRAARLQAVTAALANTESVKDVAQAVVSQGVAALSATGGSLMMPADAEHLAVAATVGYAEPLVDRLRAEHPDADLPAATALRTGEPVWLETRDERDRRFPGLTGLEPGTTSMCAVPLKAGRRVLGALRFSFDAPRLFDADERLFVLTVADQTASALDRAAALSALREANDRLAFLAEASAALGSSLDYRETLRTVARLAVPRLADWCTVHMLEDGALPALAVAHSDPAKVAYAEEAQRRYPTDMSATTGLPNVVRTGTSELYPVITADAIAAAARDDEHLEMLRELRISSALIVPLSAHGRVFGAISMIYAESGRHYDQSDLSVAEDLAHRAAQAIVNANLYRALEERDA
jgi:GAF domain-containing protein/anti-sigma regulatory factor (Ser/Thr protein kinase)